MFWFKQSKEDKEAEQEKANDNDTSATIATSSHQPQHEEEHDCCSNDKNTQQLRQEALEDLRVVKRRNKELQAQIEELKTKQTEQESQLKKKQAKQKSKQRGSVTAQEPASKAASDSSKQVTSLQAEVQGYKQLVDALTTGRPAIEAAVQALNHPKIKYASTSSFLPTSQSPLPLHTVRFLELQPWHPLAQNTTTIAEQLVEWQVYHPAQQVWRSQLVFFPTFFKALPVVKPQEGDKKPRPGVWTNPTLTQRLDLQMQGYYALPSSSSDHATSPTWKWIGEWHVEASTTERDPDGWAYAQEAGHFLLQGNNDYLIPPAQVYHQLDQLAASCSANRAMGHSNTRLIRRRIWTRKRTLVNYPQAAQSTVQYLALRAQAQQLEWDNRFLRQQWEQHDRQLDQKEEHVSRERQQWNQELGDLKRQLQEAKEQVQHYQELLERQRGPPLQQFSLNVNTTALGSDDDCSTVSDCSSTSTTSSCSDVLAILHHEEQQGEGEITQALHTLDQLLEPSPEPEVVVEFKTSSFLSHLSRWRHSTAAVPQEEPAPGVEACSDCSEEEDDDITISLANVSAQEQMIEQIPSEDHNNSSLH